MTKRRPRVAPAQAKTHDQICELTRDNVDGKGWWAILDPPWVVVHQQKPGEDSTGRVQIPRDEFAKLARWYLTGRFR